MAEETKCPLCGMFPDAEPIEELRKELTFYKDREKHFASVLKVADGGQYRADWDGAILNLKDRAVAAETLLGEVEHYVRYGDGQMQGTRTRLEQNAPSVETERGRILRLLHPYRKP